MFWRNRTLIAIIVFIASCGESSTTLKKPNSYASTKSLIEAEELLGVTANYILIDLRKPEEYASGHLPQALNVWRNQITDSSYAYGGMIPTQHQFENLLSGLGITPTDTIVIYDDKAECDAARLWWILKFYGHQHIKLLNGGLAAWLAVNGQITNDFPKIEKSTYRFSNSPDSSVLALLSDVELAISDSEIIILDTRGVEEYSGKFQKSGAAKPGRINQAINIDWATAVDYNGTKKFRSSKELSEIYKSAQTDTTNEIIVYCHTGVRSAHTFFVLSELLGYKNVKNYDGSWTEWSQLR